MTEKELSYSYNHQGTFSFPFLFWLLLNLQYQCSIFSVAPLCLHLCPWPLLHLQLTQWLKETQTEMKLCILQGYFVVHVRQQFFYLLDYISFSGISKSGNRKKKIKIELCSKTYQLFVFQSTIFCWWCANMILDI